MLTFRRQCCMTLDKLHFVWSFILHDHWIYATGYKLWKISAVNGKNFLDICTRSCFQCRKGTCTEQIFPWFERWISPYNERRSFIFEIITCFSLCFLYQNTRLQTIFSHNMITSCIWINLFLSENHHSHPTQHTDISGPSKFWPYSCRQIGKYIKLLYIPYGVPVYSIWLGSFASCAKI